MTYYKKGDIIHVQMTVGIDGVSGSVDGLPVWAAFGLSKPSNCHNVPVTAIIKHMPRELQVGDKVKMAFPNGSHLHSDLEFTVICICDGHAWIKNGNSSPITFSVDKLERV